MVSGETSRSTTTQPSSASTAATASASVEASSDCTARVADIVTTLAHPRELRVAVAPMGPRRTNIGSGEVDMDAIQMGPVGVVRGGRTEAIDDDWGASEATIALDSDRFSPDVVAGSRRPSRIVDVVYVFHLVDPTDVTSVHATRAAGRTGPRSGSSPSAPRRGPTASASRRASWSVSTVSNCACADSTPSTARLCST